MEKQKLFKISYVQGLINNLKENRGTDSYLKNRFEHDPNEILSSKTILISQKPELISPKKGKNFQFENSKIIFECYKKLTLVQASDVRLWTYLSHVDFWDYMMLRSSVSKITKPKRGEFILQHWFCYPLNAKNLLRNELSLLWWGAYLSYDSDRKDPYEMTKELFSMLDYTRTLLPSVQGRNRNFTQALLEFVLENFDLFRQYKESKVRFLMRKLNYIGGYTISTVFSKNEIKNIFKQYEEELRKITS